MNDVAKTVDDARAIEVDAGRRLVLQRVERGSLRQWITRERERMPAECFEERMPRRDPFELLGFGSITVGGTSGVTVCNCRQLPVRVLFVASQQWWRSGWIECVREVRHRLQRPRDKLGGVVNESRNRLRHDASLLRTRASLDQHLQVELLTRQSLERVLADGTELLLVHLPKQTVFEVGVSQLAGVIVAKDALDMGSG
jgi:hypothetical protein